jgi:hypothetical protein
MEFPLGGTHLSIWKKAISVATSAALLASLLTAVAAPAAFAANTSAGGGIIYPDYGAGDAFSLTFAEDTIGQFAASGSFKVIAHDANGNAAAVDFITTAAPTVTRNLGLGTASAGFDAAGDLVVNASGLASDKIDSFTIGGLTVEALGTAVQGALIFLVVDDLIGLSESLVTVTGTTTSNIDGGLSTAVAYALDNPASPIDFQVTGTTCNPIASNPLKVGQVTVAAAGAAPAETFSAVAPTGAGVITKGSTFTANKPIGTAVSQSVCATIFPSPVTVGNAVLVYPDEARAVLQAGTNSNSAAAIGAQLGFFDGLLKSGDTVTFTIDTAGVAFSPETASVTVLPTGGMTVGTPSLGAERKSVTVALTADQLVTDAGGIDYLYFDPLYDVASTVPNATFVDVSVTVSRAGVVVLDSPVTVAQVGFLGFGSTAAPTVYIGQNDQSTGMITIKESVAGAIAGSRQFSICLADNPGDDYDSVNENWSVGRSFWAVVTVGDLKLNVAGLPVTQAKLDFYPGFSDCLTVRTYSKSTVASTIEIRDGTSSAPAASGPTAGPKVNVSASALPGQTYVKVYDETGTRVADNIVIAVRAYTGTPTATTSGQLPVVRGMLNQAAGSITFTEGAPNQFGSSYYLELCLVDPSSSFKGAYLWSNPVGANAPVVTTNSTVSGLIATFDPYWSGDTCLYLNTTDSGLSGLGTITISNLKLDVKGDAPLGPVFVRIYTGRYINGSQVKNGVGSGAALQATVSPATVVEKKAINISAVSALGLIPNQGPWTTGTTVAPANKFITWKFDGGAALAGKTVRIYGGWGPFVNLTGRVANAAGIAEFHWRSTNQWVSVRAYYPGDAMYLASWSSPRQGRWLA